MSDLISRKRIEYELCESNMPKKYRDFCRRVINSEDLSPSVDAEPVRHGRWEQIDVQPYFRKHYYNSDVCCSVCHVRGNLKYNYCPNCGAKMKKEK